MPDHNDWVHGDVPYHPILHRLREMKEVEDKHGRNPDAVLPRFWRWCLDLWRRW